MDVRTQPNRLLQHELLMVAGIATFFYVVVSAFKYAAGADERAFFSLGEHFLRTGEYLSPKHHPLYAILIGLPSLVGLNALASAKIAFVISGVILWMSIYVIFLLTESKSLHLRLLQTIFVGSMPGISTLVLYSGSSLLYLALAVSSIALTLYAFVNVSRAAYALCGVFYGLSYLARIDGLILLALLGIYFFLNRDAQIKRNYLFLVIAGFLVTIIPWHVYLYSNRLFFSTIVQGGWNSSVWIDGPMKYILAADGQSLLNAGILANVLRSFAKNVLLYSQHLGSLRVIPFFYIAFIGFAFLPKRIMGQLVCICLPIVATLPYLLFYIEARYLAPAALSLAILAAIGLNNMLDLFKARNSYAYILLIGINLALIFSYLLFGHETYSLYR